MPGKNLLSTTERVAAAAHRLAIQFSDEGDLPSQFRRKPDGPVTKRNSNPESAIEIKCQAAVASWYSLIEYMLERMEEDCAWRFHNLKPQVTPGIHTVSQNEDFRSLIEYMALRRDREGCGLDELGNLALLSIMNQRVLENPLDSQRI